MSDAVFVNTGALYSKSDLQEYKRKLRNKIVFTQPLCDVEPLLKRLLSVRLLQEELDYMAEVDLSNNPATIQSHRKSNQALLREETPRRTTCC